LDANQKGKIMRIAIIGAGAIGGLLAARLTAAGEDVSVVVRGAQKDAISRNGLKVFGLPEG
jgi:2-dehydropantoate 2-reductase